LLGWGLFRSGRLAGVLDQLFDRAVGGAQIAERVHVGRIQDVRDVNAQRFGLVAQFVKLGNIVLVGLVAIGALAVAVSGLCAVGFGLRRLRLAVFGRLLGRSSGASKNAASARRTSKIT